MNKNQIANKGLRRNIRNLSNVDKATDLVYGKANHRVVGTNNGARLEALKLYRDLFTKQVDLIGPASFLKRMGTTLLFKKKCSGEEEITFVGHGSYGKKFMDELDLFIEDFSIGIKNELLLRNGVMDSKTFDTLFTSGELII